VEWRKGKRKRGLGKVSRLPRAVNAVTLSGV